MLRIPCVRLWGQSAVAGGEGAGNLPCWATDMEDIGLFEPIVELPACVKLSPAAIVSGHVGPADVERVATRGYIYVCMYRGFPDPERE
jgi:hypothetical protein